MKRVVVIGAGPAGSAAAMRLTRYRNLEVQLLDRAAFPRRKVCGSGLSPWALELLDEMGLGPAVRREAYPIRCGLIIGARGQRVELRSGYEAAVLLRARFDTLLAHEAARRGAALREGVRVDEIVRQNDQVVGLRTSEGELEADAVIVTNGANSTLARADRPGKTLHSIMGWYEGVAGITDAVELYFDPVVKPYYGWVFPESKQRVNIGICYGPEPGSLNARQRFAAFLERHLAGRLKHATQLDRLVGFPIATTARPTALVEQGMLVAGEAAQLVDPLTAEGIHHALASGDQAGRVLGRVLANGEAPTMRRLAPYTRLVRRQIGRRLQASQLFLHLAKTPALDLVLRFGALRPTQSFLSWVLAGA